MKKFKIIFLMILVLFLVTGCSKKPITGEDFRVKLVALGFQVEDVTNYTPFSVDKAYRAKNDELDMPILFYIFSADATADDFYKTTKSELERAQGRKKLDLLSVFGLSKMEAVYDGKYHVISRIDYTTVYAVVDEKDEKIVSKIVKSLGY